MKKIILLSALVLAAFASWFVPQPGPPARHMHSASLLPSGLFPAAAGSINQAAADVLALRVPQLPDYTVEEVAVMTDELCGSSETSFDYVAMYRLNGKGTYCVVFYNAQNEVQFTVEQVTHYDFRTSAESRHIILEYTTAEGQSRNLALVVPGSLQVRQDS